MSEKEILAKLFRRLEGGDESAMVEIWNRFGPAIRRRARTRLVLYGIRSSLESMDICQSIMADILRRKERGNLALPEDFERYIVKAVENKVVDALRRLTAQKRDRQRDVAFPVEDLAIAGNESTASARAMRADLIERVKQEMTDDEREVYELMLQDLGWTDIALRLGKTPDGIRVRMARAFRRVRARIGIEES